MAIESTPDFPEAIAELRALIDEGLADLDAGRVVEEFDLKGFLADRRREFDARHDVQ